MPLEAEQSLENKVGSPFTQRDIITWNSLAGIGNNTGNIKKTIHSALLDEIPPVGWTVCRKRWAVVDWTAADPKLLQGICFHSTVVSSDFQCLLLFSMPLSVLACLQAFWVFLGSVDPILSHYRSLKLPLPGFELLGACLENPKSQDSNHVISQHL